MTWFTTFICVLLFQTNCSPKGIITECYFCNTSYLIMLSNKNEVGKYYSSGNEYSISRSNWERSCVLSRPASSAIFSCARRRHKNELKSKQLKAVLYYIKEATTCKSKLLLRYFGETINYDCGICSHC